MKSLVRWSATLGLVGSALLGSFFTENLRALALPEDQVVQKLQSVPVFTVTDPQGSPLVASVPNGQNQTQAVAGVFISQRDAQAFVERLKKEKPDLARNVQVVPVSLAEVYKLDRENQNQPAGLDFAYIPVQQQVQSAQALMSQNGQQAQQFQGTPLFVARGGENQGYLTIQQNGQSVIPFFFDKEQLQLLVDRFKQQQPNLASTVKLQAVTLEGVIQTLQTENNPQLNNIVLVPSKEAIDFLRSRTGASGQSAPQAAPQNAPQAPQQR
jgi:nickel transport protein